jgi:hypothetical protein
MSDSEEDELSSEYYDSDEEEHQGRIQICTCAFTIKLIFVVILSTVLGLYITVKIVQLYLPTPEQDLPTPPRDVALRIENAKNSAGEVTIMWEPSLEGEVTHYRIYRWNELLGHWMELYFSPTQKLGTKDKMLPARLNQDTKISYKIVAENPVNQSKPEYVWFYHSAYNYTEFQLPTTSRAVPAPIGIKVEDISNEEGAERLHIQWDRPSQDPLGYQVFRRNSITKQFDLVEEYTSIRYYSRCPMSNFPLDRLYCFVVKTITWGDIGLSEPSFERCIYITEWFWQRSVRQKELAGKQPFEIPRYKQLFPFIGSE